MNKTYVSVFVFLMIFWWGSVRNANAMRMQSMIAQPVNHKEVVRVGGIDVGEEGLTIAATACIGLSVQYVLYYTTGYREITSDELEIYSYVVILGGMVYVIDEAFF